MQEIREKLGIPSSAGIGTNMYLAKIALDITAKHSPDRIGWLDEERFIKTLWNHKPLTDFWQISQGISSRLAKYGIYDMEGIAKADENVLYKEFGVNAELLIDHARGKESCLMKDIKEYKGKAKSISSSQILPYNYNFEDGKMVLNEMIQTGCYELARQHLSTQLIHVIVNYGDDRYSTVKGMKRMSETTNLFSFISKYANEIYDEIVDPKRPVRRITYEFSLLIDENFEKYDLFTDFNQIEKEKKLVKSVLSLQEKFGKNTILKGIDLKENATQIERNNTIGGHKSGEN